MKRDDLIARALAVVADPISPARHAAALRVVEAARSVQWATCHEPLIAALAAFDAAKGGE
jgi:hypothetical protein